MTKPLHQTYLLLPLVFITWWTLTFGFTSTTHTAIAANTVINITDKTKQTQDSTNISRDVDNASFTMTEINTEVLDIRADISKEVSVEGFEAVGDYAMGQEAAGDEEWADGGIKKTLAHAAVGAVVGAIGNGDALGGATGAGARELVSNASKDEDEATQQWVSATVGAVVGGGTGASVAKDGEAFNRQLHQKEIKWISENAGAYAEELYGDSPTAEQIADAKTALTEQALRGVDKGWSLKLGDTDNDRAKAFLKDNDAQMFVTKSDSEYYDPTITRYGDTTTKIKDLDQNKKDALKDFYKDNVKNASTESLKELYIADLKTRGVDNAEAVWEGIKNTPEGLKSLYEYIDKTPIGEIGGDIVEGVKNIAKDVKDTATEGADAYQSSSEIAHNTDGTADLLNELYDDDTAATTGRMMVDEDLFEAVTLVGGLAKGAITGIKKLGNGNVEIQIENGKSLEVPEDVAYDNKGVYDPNAVRTYLEDKHGAQNIAKHSVDEVTGRNVIETTGGQNGGWNTTLNKNKGDRLLLIHFSLYFPK